MQEDGSGSSLFVIDGVAGGGGGDKGGGSSKTQGVATRVAAQDYASDSDGEDEGSGAVEAAAESLDDAMAQLQQLQQMGSAAEIQDTAATGGAAGVLGYVKGGMQQDGQPVDEEQARPPDCPVEEEEGYLSDE